MSHFLEVQELVEGLDSPNGCKEIVITIPSEGMVTASFVCFVRNEAAPLLREIINKSVLDVQRPAT